MVRAWYINSDVSIPGISQEFIEYKDLFRKTGVEYYKISDQAQVEQLKNDRGYTYEDEMECSEAFPDYEEKIKSFYTEHLHSDEEIRHFIKGSGYFDVRDCDDRWIRIEVGPGELIILPSGIYHRFTLGSENYVKIKRLFTKEPVWKAYNRPADEMECRREYIGRLSRGFPVQAS